MLAGSLDIILHSSKRSVLGIVPRSKVVTTLAVEQKPWQKAPNILSQSVTSLKLCREIADVGVVILEQ